MASKALSLLLLLLPLFASVIVAAAAAAGPVNITGSRDITKVLDQFPNFSTLNKLLTQTKVADQINSRQTVTLLAVADSAMSSLTGLPADVQEKVLSLHVLLDYYDIDKITNLPNATALLTTLFQASGKAVGKAGFLNATYVGDGQIKLGSAVDGILTSDVIREIAMQPYNLSVIEVSHVVVPPGIASGGNGSATPSPAPKAEDTPAPPKEAPASAPKEAPVSPSKAAPTPKPSTSPSPSAIPPSPKGNSSDDSPAPATDGPVSSPVSSPPTRSSTAPAAEAPAGPADAPAGPADAPVGSADAPVGSPDAPAGPTGSADAPVADHPSSASCLTVGAGIGAAIGAAAFLAVL